MTLHFGERRGAALLVTEIATKSPFLCVNRYHFGGGDNFGGDWGVISVAEIISMVGIISVVVQVFTRKANVAVSKNDVHLLWMVLYHPH